MAIDAHSTTAPAVQPGLLRTWAGAVPVPTPALTAETVALLDAIPADVPHGGAPICSAADLPCGAASDVRHRGAGVCATVAQTAVAETVAMLDGLTPAPLPSLPDAFTRRRALFGAVVLAAAPVAALAPLPAAAATPSQADARLLALADAYEALERRCHEHTAAHRHLRGRAFEISEAEFDAIVEGFLPIEEEVTATPADSLAGVLAKARMCQVPTSRHCAQFDHVQSVADDLHRLFGGHRHG